MQSEADHSDQSDIRPKLNAGIEGDIVEDEEWYRRYLPHRDRLHLLQSITFRLGDSLPQSKLRELEEETRLIPFGLREAARRQKIEDYLDLGAGCCALQNPAMAETVQKSLFHSHGIRYRLLEWCIMPNHVHVVIEP